MKTYKCVIPLRTDFTIGKIYTVLGQDDDVYLMIDNNDNVKRLTLFVLSTCFDEIKPFKFGK